MLESPDRPRPRDAEPSLLSRGLLAAAVLAALIMKAPSWDAIAWDDEDLMMAVLRTALHARYWAEGVWLPVWNVFQGFGLPHPSPTHLIYSPLFPLMLVTSDGMALAMHYSIMSAIGVGSIFVLSRRLGASPLLAFVGALTWFSSTAVTQILFVDLWTQAFTYACLAPVLVILMLNWLDAGARPVRVQSVLVLGLTGGVVLSSTTPAGSVPFALPLAVMTAIHVRVNGWSRARLLVPAFLVALAIYSPVLLELWQEMGQHEGVRSYTMDVRYPAMGATALLWPFAGDERPAGWGAPFVVAALISIAANLRPGGGPRGPLAGRLMAGGAAACVAMYVLPVSIFPLASGNGTWGQLLPIFAIPIAAGQLTALYREHARLRAVLAGVVVVQAALVGCWGVIWWNQQTAKAGLMSVGQLMRTPSDLERTLMQRARPNRDRVLLSSAAEQQLFRIEREGHEGHFANFARLGIPIVNGLFKFVSYQNVYAYDDATWGAIRTKGESLTPEILDVAGISFLVTADEEAPADPSLQLVGRYFGHREARFRVWQNLDVWPRVAFIDPALERERNDEAGMILWRRRRLPTRSAGDARFEVAHPGSYVIRFEPSPSDRLLLIADYVRPDLMTVRGASLVADGPLSDAFAIVKVPAGAAAVEVTWEAPLRRALWQLSYLTVALGALACAVLTLRDRTMGGVRVRPDVAVR